LRDIGASWAFNRKLVQERRVASAKAAEWLCRLQSGTCQATDRQAFVDWFDESSIHREQFFVAGIRHPELDILKLVASLHIKATDWSYIARPILGTKVGKTFANASERLDDL
jgi:hypothetical protein